MSSIQKSINAYVMIKQRIKEQQTILKDMRNEENAIMKEIKNYLNQTGESGIRIDDDTVVSITSHEKKITWPKKEYEEKVKLLLYSRGIEDDEFVNELLDRTHDVVQQQKLKIVKS